jgi:hypothetical protein
MDDLGLLSFAVRDAYFTAHGRQAADSLTDEEIETTILEEIKRDGDIQSVVTILEERHTKKCKTYGCTYRSDNEHARKCPGSVSFRPRDRFL